MLLSTVTGSATNYQSGSNAALVLDQSHDTQIVTQCRLYKNKNKCLLSLKNKKMRCN